MCDTAGCDHGHSVHRCQVHIWSPINMCAWLLPGAVPGLTPTHDPWQSWSQVMVAYRLSQDRDRGRDHHGDTDFILLVANTCFCASQSVSGGAGSEWQFVGRRWVGKFAFFTGYRQRLVGDFYQTFGGDGAHVVQLVAAWVPVSLSAIAAIAPINLISSSQLTSRHKPRPRQLQKYW